MKPKFVRVIFVLAVAFMALLGAWHWQSNYAENVKSIPVPKWLAGGENLRYSIAIGKSQIKPYGTIWKSTSGPGWHSMVPIYNDRDVEKYLARQK